jgi:DNA-binding transcriptional MerR regulator
MTATNRRGLTIAAAAERTGLSPDTLRYYERIGLISPVPRTAAGHRVYQDEDIARVEFVLLLRATGMPVREMRTYFRLLRDGDHTILRRREMLAAQRHRLGEQERRLRATIDHLDRKIRVYDARLVAAAERPAPAPARGGGGAPREEEGAAGPRGRAAA